MRHRAARAAPLLRNCVQRHLRENLRENLTDDGALRPLGELVPCILRELKAISGTSNADQTTARVLAMPLIAAFVDGNVSADEASVVCVTALSDNSVLAEIIAAVRSSQEFETAPPLTNELTSRLLALQRFETIRF